MCDATSIVLLAVAAAGAGAQAKGQHDAAKSTKRTLANALNAQESLRKKALTNSEQVVDGQGAEAIAKESQKPQQVVAQEGAAGDQIAKAFTDSSGVGSSDQGRITGAVRGAKRTAANEATTSGFSRALQANLARLGNLTTNNLLLSKDSQAINDRLPYQLQQAGQSGANMRLIGQLALTGSQAGLSSNAWSANGAQPSSAGLTGVDYGTTYRRPTGNVQV